MYLSMMHGLSMLPIGQYRLELLSVLRKHLVIGQFSFSLFFIGHHLETVSEETALSF